MSEKYIADETKIAAAGMKDVVRNARGTIVCYTRECDGLTATENAERIAKALSQGSESSHPPGETL